MNIHEYQAKKLFRAFGIPVPQGKNITSVEEVLRAIISEADEES